MSLIIPLHHTTSILIVKTRATNANFVPLSLQFFASCPSKRLNHWIDGVPLRYLLKGVNSSGTSWVFTSSKVFQIGIRWRSWPWFPFVGKHGRWELGGIGNAAYQAMDLTATPRGLIGATIITILMSLLQSTWEIILQMSLRNSEPASFLPDRNFTQGLSKAPN